MKAKPTLLLLAILALAAAVAIWWPRAAPASITAPTVDAVSTRSSARQVIPGDLLQRDRFGRFAGMSAAELMKNRPKLHKARGYPPQTPEAVEMWQWWNAIDKADPSFEWQMPINFYGKVVDQKNHPVGHAKVFWETSVIGGAAKGTVFSGPDGQFEITGLIGKGMNVTVWADGYHTPNSSKGSYEYAAFHEDNFHEPDPANPVVFHLYKYQDPEPMYHLGLNQRIAIDGTPAWIDLSKGQLSENGQLAVIVQKSAPIDVRESDYVLTIRAAAGGGLVQSKDEDMYQAPENGYQSEWRVVKDKDDINVTRDLKFYVRSPAGKYAAVLLRITQANRPSAGLDAQIFYNPSGSRNLEFDGKHELILRR